MKKLSLKQVSVISGGGCNRWLRAARRATDQEIKNAALEAFDICIYTKYKE